MFNVQPIILPLTPNVNQRLTQERKKKRKAKAFDASCMWRQLPRTTVTETTGRCVVQEKELNGEHLL